MATASFSASINLNTGAITLTDTSDFVSQGIALINVNGNFKITAPSGSVIYENTSYYFETGTAQAGSTTTMQLAVGATSLPLANYYLLATGGAGVNQNPRVTSYNGLTKLATFPTESVAFNNTTTYRLCLADIFLAADLSNQTTISLMVNGVTEQGTYTIDYLVYDSNLGQFYTAQSTIDYVYTLPTVAIAQTVNCVQRIFSSTDITDYTLYGGIAPTSLTRTHTIYYPPTLVIPDVVGSTSNLYAPSLYNNGTYTTGISTVVSWVVNGSTITATLTGSAEKTVECAWVCELYCCIQSLYNNWRRYINTNTTKAEEYREMWLTAIGLSIMVSDDGTCANGANIDSYIQVFRAETDCNSGCQCDDEVITLVPSLANLINTYNVTSLSTNWLTVTPVVSGVSTDFQLALTNAAITALTAGNVVTADTNTRVTQTGSGSSASFAVKGAVVTTGIGVKSTFTGGTTNPVYTQDIQNLLGSRLQNTATTTNSAWEDLRTLSVPAGTLTTIGDMLTLWGFFTCTGNTDAKEVRIEIAGVTIFSAIPADLAQITQLDIKIRLVRRSATQVAYYFNYSGGNAIAPSIREITTADPTTLITVNNLDSLSNDVVWGGYSIATGDVTLTGSSMEIKKL